jgi:hypothetical protein
MREIRFKIWDKEEKKMFYPESQEFILIPTLQNWGADKHYDSPRRNENDREKNDMFDHWFADESCFDWASADLISGRYISLQFTGLKDKNGKEIYEGDILKHSDYKSPLYVYFCECCAGFRLQLKNYGNNELIDQEDEIIGNIYENSELLI